MKFSIGHRLFLAMLLSVVTAATTGMLLVRWKLFDNFSAYSASTELESLDDFTDAVLYEYRLHKDWSFLPNQPEKRKHWAFERLARLQQDQKLAIGAQPLSPNLGYRIGLLDKDEHYLAGTVANSLMVAVASIDRVQRPLIVDGKTVGFLVIAKTKNSDNDLVVAFMLQQQRNFFLVGFISIVFGAIVAVLFAAHFRKPIRLLVDGTQALKSGRLDIRLNIRRSDELGELGSTFNHLAQRLEDVERSRQQWVANTSHELRTPLSVLKAQMESFQDGIRTANPENIAMMLRQIESLTKRVDDLYELARADIGQLQYRKINEEIWPLARDVFDSFSEKFLHGGLTATITTSPDSSNVLCDTNRIRQVLTNLFENCVRYTAKDGRVEMQGIAINDTLQIIIDDSAPGVPEYFLGRLGERFFRAESSHIRQVSGTGLGLTLCRHIIEEHEGRLEFSQSSLGGLRAIIVLKLED